MRFIIHELPYEQPLLAGRLRYEREGQPTGAVESWRLSAAAEGYRFLRVDLDARLAASGRSWLYHAVLDPAGLPEQVKARFWDKGREVVLTAVRDGQKWFASRQFGGASYQEAARGQAFWFPAGSGLALLRHFVGSTRGVTFIMDTSVEERTLALAETPVQIVLGEPVTAQIEGESLPARPLLVSWSSSRRTVWLDDEGRPLRLWRDDGLTATAERLVRYGR